jgi:hypothetical protein
MAYGRQLACSPDCEGARRRRARTLNAGYTRRGVTWQAKEIRHASQAQANGIRDRVHGHAVLAFDRSRRTPLDDGVRGVSRKNDDPGGATWLSFLVCVAIIGFAVLNQYLAQS